MTGVEQLRCLTFNLWENCGDLAVRLPAIREVIDGAAPDVVALQACFAAPDLGIDVAAFLAAECGYLLTRFPLRAQVRPHAGQSVQSRSDLALLSRLPPLASGCIPLQGDPRDGERGLLWIDHPIVGDRVRVACTQLTPLRDRDGETLRERQGEELAARLISWTQFGPVVLMGDLNARAGADELLALLDNPLLPTASAPRAWRMTGHWPGINDGIDHVLLFPGASGASFHARRILAEPDPDRPETWTSDHPAVLAEVSFVRSEAAGRRRA